MRRLATWFFRGLLISVPAALTVYVCWIAIRWFDRLLGTSIPGLGVLTALALITLIGALASNLFTRGAVAFVDRSLERLPFARLLYTSTKDLLNAFVGEQRRFNRPVKARIGDGPSAIYVLGFVTAETLSHLELAEHVAVYLPFSYSVAGHVLLLPADRVTPVAVDAADAMAFLVSGGVTRTAAAGRAGSRP